MIIEFVLVAAAIAVAVYAAAHSSKTRKLFAEAIAEVRLVTDKVEAAEKAAKAKAEEEAQKLADAVAAEAAKATAEAKKVYDEAVAAAKKAFDDAQTLAKAAAASKVGTEVKNVGAEVVQVAGTISTAVETLVSKA